MTKLHTLDAIIRTGVVLIVRLGSAEDAIAAASAAVEGGVEAVEIPLTTPGSLGAVEVLAARFPHAHIGSGTALDGYAAYAAIDAGARFLVSPQLNPEMLRTANRYQVATISGALTPTEILAAAEAGADIVKLFPTEGITSSYARAILAPIAHVPVMPAGGVTLENVGLWFEAGVVAVGVGSSITKAGGPTYESSAITAAAQKFVAAIHAAR